MHCAVFYPESTSDFQSLLNKLLPDFPLCKDRASFEHEVLEGIESVLHKTLLNKELVTDCYNLLFNSPISRDQIDLKNLYEVARQVRDLYAYFTEETTQTKIFEGVSTSPTIVHIKEKPRFLTKSKHRSSYFRS